MDIEKLIEQLNDFNENHISVLCGSGQCACGYLCDKDDCIVVRAATALSTLQAENEKLRADLNDLKAQWDMYGGDEGITAMIEERDKLKAEWEKYQPKEHWDTLNELCENLHDKLEQERDHRLHAEEHADLFLEDCKRLNVELEQVKAERDAAVSWAQKYTESIDRPCVACKHNTGDYVCTTICGNCGPMGTESCKWEFDFSGELKEG